MCVTAALDQPSHLQPSNMCLGHFGLDGLLGMCALRRSIILCIICIGHVNTYYNRVDVLMYLKLRGRDVERRY